MKTNKTKKASKIEIVSPEEYGKYMTETLTSEVLRLVDDDEPRFGADWALTVRLNLIASVMSTMVYRCLSQEPKAAASFEEATSLAHSGYKGLKSAIEDAVAVAFQGAFQTYTDKPADFYVQISPIPEPTNELPC